jgi:hypothetical protein
MRTLRIGVQVVNEDRDRLRRVTRSLEHLKPHPSKRYPLPVRQGRERILGVRTTAQVDPGALPVTQLEMPGDEVGVKMSQEHMPDPASQSVGVLDILVNITLRIHHRRDGAPLVSHQIGRMRQTPQVVLLQNQHGPPPRQRPPASTQRHRTLPLHC